MDESTIALARRDYNADMNPRMFDSFSQNGEDVVLWRALRHVRNGRYIDVGANHPCEDSVTMAFYQAGWSGVTVEPDPNFALIQRDERPRDYLFEAAITTKDGDITTLHVVDGTGLSTLHQKFADVAADTGYAVHDIEVPTRTMNSILEEMQWQGSDIHFMSVDTEGSERSVIESMDLAVWRPWILVIEATNPNSTESSKDAWEERVLDSGYELCLFDGLSCFYVAKEHARALRPALTYPACILDQYTTLEMRELIHRSEGVPSLIEQVARWRSEAISAWASLLASRADGDASREQIHQLHEANRHLALDRDGFIRLIQELKESTSWRATAPLRWVSRVTGFAKGER